jgi:hypothetical protein
VLDNHRLRNRASRISHEILEQRILARLEVDDFRSATDFAREEIKGEIAARETIWFRDCVARRINACTLASNSVKANGLVR